MRWYHIAVVLIGMTVGYSHAQPSVKSPACKNLADESAKRACFLERAKSIEVCAAVSDNFERLICYDKLSPVPQPSGTSTSPFRCSKEAGVELDNCRIDAAKRIADCAVHADMSARLTCADSAARLQPAGKPAIDTALGWKVREEITINALGKQAAGKTGAKLAYSDEKHKESIKGSVAGLYVWDNVPLGALGDWQPFAGLWWKGDSGSAPKTGSLTATAGAQAEKAILGSLIQPSVLLSRRHERYVDRDTTQVTVNADVLFDLLRGSTSGGFSYDFVPLVGVNAAKVSAATGAPGGSTHGLYAGMRFTLNHSKLFPRASVEGFGQWYGDSKELPGADERRVRYGTLKLIYNLADPENKSGWVPAISLSGTRGTEPVRGDQGVRKVGLEFSARFN